MSAITSELAHLSGPLAYLVVAALVFGETALFFGFVLPGEIAVVLGGEPGPPKPGPRRARVPPPDRRPVLGCRSNRDR